MSTYDFDAIVVGSGFGGAVSACRLAEQGQKVLVLERGRHWTPETYPREADDAWIWDQARPHKQNGWVDLRTFADMWVAAGAGVGGGSLIYANVSVEAKPEMFRHGWPPEITHEVLKPYYDRVGAMLDVQELPEAQWSEHTRLMQESAQKCGWGDRFHTVPLAVSFDREWRYDLADAHADHHSRKFINAQGKLQGTCVHCGNCDIGCQVSAKNTLDLNYLALAESKGAEIWPLHLVCSLEPEGTGWRIHADCIKSGQRRRRIITAQRVILAAGSIGSTELLLRCRDQHRSLPALSSRLGHGWAFNGDFVTPAFYKSRAVSPSRGVTISSAIDLLDRSVDGQALFIEDGGIPNLLGAFIKRRVRHAGWGKLRRSWKELGALLDAEDPFANMMLWFGQGVDASDGQMYLGRPWYAPWQRSLKMHWHYERSEAMVEAMAAVHTRLSHATGGEPWVPPTWTYLRNLITPHPLGGCNMGLTAAEGVVDARGRVFGYENLYVMDGSTIPRAIGLNPSRTIAALAELNCERLGRDG
ncbi:GMC family oxidoreductase [Paralcaligenes sp. KSB-10]|uniref:FAD-dependent oxidoreductase n=1 Tax=Paralcaligenes sp. KSB-10 TaxID=2901142 RepID=UPI001E3520ED|nr:GMC family oxidoreductase [Paralcaligenes sp. KSB-10]UHL62977.1 GMC family oxidoreductase [Paralcaligenes sp. KSB-10]